MVKDDAPYLCNNCGIELYERDRCGLYMKCGSCGNQGYMADVATRNNLENKASKPTNRRRKKL